MNPHQQDFEYPSSPQPLQQVRPDFLALPPPPATDFLATGLTQSQRKKRTKLVPVNSPGTSSSSGVQKKKYSKPDPAAPKITEPCSECGKKFWSWKALFGHMRCHPERQWRGINPPPSMLAAITAEAASSSMSLVEMTEEDHEVAASLLLLASGGHAPVESSAIVVRDGEGEETATCRFECSCCKKVFGSHQALGGHRASHRNVKGCFANTRSEGDEEGECGPSSGGPGASSSSMALIIRHSCSICSKVFSTGQALGGHMRCHWEKSDEPHLAPSTPQCPSNPSAPAVTSNILDLNAPASLDHHDPSSCSSSGLRLDLRLGL